MDEQTKQIIGERIRKLRKQQKLSEAQLAIMAGVSRVHVCQIELAKTNPTVTVLRRIARALGTTLSALVEGL